MESASGRAARSAGTVRNKPTGHTAPGNERSVRIPGAFYAKAYPDDYDYQYRYCLNISFNEDGTPGRGSAIFLHCFGPWKPWTGGCVAIPENIMRKVMQNVREDCVVVIDTFENLGVE